jgi:hypothetical protein
MKSLIEDLAQMEEERAVIHREGGSGVGFGFEQLLV